MKRLVALICVCALVFSFCGCRETTEETSVLSWYEGEDVVEYVDTPSNDKESDDMTSGDSTTNDTSSADETLSSTTSNVKESVDNTNNTNNTNTVSNPLDVDLKGATINVYEVEIDGITSIFSPNASESKTAAAKAKNIEKIQKDLNCKFKVTKTTADKLKSFVSTSAASGKALCNIISTSMSQTGYYISANLVANLKKISSVDLSKEYMNRYGVLEASRFGNAQYAIAAEGEGRTFVVCFNKRILKEIGKDEKYIYNLVDSGKWTLNEYRNLAKSAMKDLDGKSGMSSADQWGQIVQDGETGFPLNVLSSLGTSMLKVNSSGVISYNMTDSKVIQAINLTQDTINNDGTRYSEGTVDERVQAFANGRSLFLYANVRRISALTSMKDDFGVVPVPSINGGKDYSSAIDWNSRVLMIPAGLSATDQYNSGAVVQAYQYLYDDVLDEMEKEFVNRYFCDDESGEYWRMAADAMDSHCVQLYAKSDDTINLATYHILWNVFRGDTTSPITEINSKKSSAEKAILDLNNKIKDK